ncbi:MAG: methionyl-tRNA formyltransferase [Oscillospiraceae bacterium]|nr:methionyl-tRNA formyltransferase [Oscillospiraceae bacterium]
MRIVFMGTPDFAVPTLTALFEAGHEIAAVFTQPDKPKGRGYTLTPPPVKEEAQRLAIPVYQPTTVKTDEVREQIAAMNADVAVVVAYGKILPKALLDTPKFGCINLHASLLPKYRGAAPIQWAVLRGERQTGVTAMQMGAGLDIGDMLMKAVTDIGENETAGELHDRLSQMSAELILKVLPKLSEGTLTAEKQDDSLSSYASMLDKSLCAIRFSAAAQEIHNQVRGLCPWPVATAEIGGRKLKIYKTRLSDMKTDCPSGTVISVSPLTVACADGTSLEILELQQEGKKRMTAQQYLMGNRIEVGSRFS